MNKLKLPVLGLGLILLITSCKKSDTHNPDILKNDVPASQASEWKIVNNWNSAKGDEFTSYNSTIEDTTITNAVAGSGLVLAFTKNGNGVNALPYEEKETNNYWHYQILKGAIIFSFDHFSGKESLTTTAFKYYVFTPEKLKDLEVKGHSKIELIKLSYENVTAILGK